MKQGHYVQKTTVCAKGRSAKPKQLVFRNTIDCIWVLSFIDLDAKENKLNTGTQDDSEPSTKLLVS